MPLFVDPSVLLVASGGENPWRDPCRAVLAAVAMGRARLHLSVEGGQEYLFHRLRRVEGAQAVAEFEQLDRLAHWHDFDADILRASADLVLRGHARGRDAVHAATALAAGFTTIVSGDADFNGIPGLVRRDPVTEVVA